MTNPYKQYQKTQVVTASREKILLMLYEGAIRFTKQARVSDTNAHHASVICGAAVEPLRPMKGTAHHR